MSGCNWHVLTLRCGCTVYVLSDPQTGMTETRIIEQRGAQCQRPAHMRGGRLWLWEILPERAPTFGGAAADKPSFASAAVGKSTFANATVDKPPATHA